MSNNVVVVRQHTSNYPNPVAFECGDKLVVGEQDPHYPGWVRITDQSGNIGWAPLEYIQLTENGASGIALKHYSAKELNVNLGDSVAVEYEYCQWCWVEHTIKGSGWVPKECLENADPSVQNR